MIALERLRIRLRTVRSDALRVSGVQVALGAIYLTIVLLSGSPGLYAGAWVILLAGMAVAPTVAYVLLPFGVLVWWLSGPPAGSASSLLAAWCLLGMFSCTVLLTASPDGVPLSATVIRRYVQRTVVVAGLTTGVWALTLLAGETRQSHGILTVVAYAALAVGLLAAGRLIGPAPPEQAED